jgi:hypothetical protein
MCECLPALTLVKAARCMPSCASVRDIRDVAACGVLLGASMRVHVYIAVCVFVYVFVYVCARARARVSYECVVSGFMYVAMCLCVGMYV